MVVVALAGGGIVNISIYTHIVIHMYRPGSWGRKLGSS